MRLWGSKVRIFCVFVCIFCLWIVPTYALEDDEVSIKGFESQIEIHSGYAYLINLDEHVVLYEKRSEEKMYPASMTKIVTLYTAIEHIKDLDERIIITEEMLEGLNEANASVAGFQVGESLTVKDILYGIMLPSGADATNAISLTLANSEAIFVDWMNETAASFGLTHTHFTNTSGLHDDEHYTTAKDLAVFLEEALKNELFREIFNAATYQSEYTPDHPTGLTFYSTMRRGEASLGLSNDIITGGKTGYTNAALRCLASYYEDDNTSYILVTGYAPYENSNIQDAHELYEYVKNHYTYTKVMEKATFIRDVAIEDSWTNTLKITAKEDIYALLDNNMDISKLQITLQGQEVYQAPLLKNSSIGDVVISYEGEEIKRVPYLLDEEIKKSIVVSCWNYIVKHIVIIIVLLIVLPLAYVYFLRWNYKRIMKRKKQKTRMKVKRKELKT